MVTLFLPTGHQILKINFDANHWLLQSEHCNWEPSYCHGYSANPLDTLLPPPFKYKNTKYKRTKDQEYKDPVKNCHGYSANPGLPSPLYTKLQQYKVKPSLLPHF